MDCNRKTLDPCHNNLVSCLTATYAARSLILFASGAFML